MNLFRSKRKAHLKLGRRSETAVAEYLTDNGFEIWARNWRTGAGELDIVAWDGRELHFVEVKSLHRKAGYSPLCNLSTRQRKRNYYAAKVYLAIMGYPQITSRFDLFELEYSRKNKLLMFRCTQDYLPEIPPREKEDITEKIAADGPGSVSEHWLKRLWDQLNFLPCPVCGNGPGRGRGYICGSCLKQLQFCNVNKRCRGCGGENDGILALCSNCLASGLDPLWIDNISLFEHRDLGRTLVLQLKFGNRPELSRQFGLLGADAVRRAEWTPEVVVAVPMAWQRRIFRSYNQAELFGRSVAAYLKIPYRNALKRTRSTPAQKRLGRTARLKNLRGAFECSCSDSVAGKRVLLTDDVFTTGATMTAAVKALMKAKPSAVYLLTISRTKPLFRKRK